MAEAKQQPDPFEGLTDEQRKAVAVQIADLKERAAQAFKSDDRFAYHLFRAAQDAFERGDFGAGVVLVSLSTLVYLRDYSRGQCAPLFDALVFTAEQLAATAQQNHQTVETALTLSSDMTRQLSMRGNQREQEAARGETSIIVEE